MKINFKKGKEDNLDFRIELLTPSKLSITKKQTILDEAFKLIKISWGEFDRKFIEDHLNKSEKISLAWGKNELLGICAVSKKNIANKIIYYIEFTVVRPKFQNSELGTKLTFRALRNVFIKNFIKIIYDPIEIMFITPNIRTISRAARLAEFIYPNPYEADQLTGKIELADDKTWFLAKELVKDENPKCILKREGLVLSGFYFSMPWFIYEDTKIPWHYNKIINKFADRYLGYNKKDGKEFVVRAQFGIISLLKYCFLNLKNLFFK